MRIAVVGPLRDLHLRRWGKALQAAGAEVLFVGLEPKPPDLEPYFCVGQSVEHPTLLDFWRRRRALRQVLKEAHVEVAHPIHLTPSAVWVWASGFRPYVPFAMGADVLEYGPQPLPLTRSWTLQGKTPRWHDSLLAQVRRHLLPPLLRATLRNALFSVADNYELCITKKFFVKNKNYVELPAGIDWEAGWNVEGEGHVLTEGLSRLCRPIVLAPRGATLLYRADVILEAFALYLKKRAPNLSLILLSGPYPPHPSITRQATELEKRFPKNFLFFKKILSQQEMAFLWQASAAVLSAPLYDGYSYALAEGRYAGCLPIVPALPAYLELLTHGYNAYFVEPFTAARLAEAFQELEDILSDPSRPWAAPNTAWIQRFSHLHDNAQTFLHLLQNRLHRR